jgi:FdhE protein
MALFADKITSLQRAAEGAPEYAEILPFFLQLFRFLEEQSAASGISFRVPEGNTALRVANGFPLIAPDSILIDRQSCGAFLEGVITLLGHIGREGSAELAAIRAALGDGRLDPAAIFSGILERKRAVIDDAAACVGVPAPLLEYVFEIPLKTALELFAATVDGDAFPQWRESHCPVCGSRPGMAELAGEEGKRRLFCSCCAFSWPFKRMQCAFCGNEDPQQLSYFTVGDGNIRVDTCTACSRYIKTRDSRKDSADLPLDLEDLLTMHLDLMAAREGFERGK